MADSTHLSGQDHGSDGTWLSSIDSWVDQVIAAGGVSVPAESQDDAHTQAEALDAIVASGGTVLPDNYDHKLSGIVTAAETVATGDVVSGHGDQTLADRVDAVSADLSGTLSQAVSTPLATLATTLDSAYLDGTISSAEQTSIVAAATALDTVLSSDSTIKLSDAYLATLSSTADDLHTLGTTGFLALDSDQLATLNAFDSVYAGYQTGDSSLSDVKAALGDINDAVGSYILTLAGDGGLGHGGGDWI